MQVKWRFNIDHPIRSMKEMFAAAEELTRKYGPYRVAVAVGQDVMNLDGLRLGQERNLIEPILVGHRRHIEEALEQLDLTPQSWQIIEEKDHIQATQKAARLVTSGGADILKRGKLLVRDFFRALLDKKMELLQPDDFWSNVAVLEVDGINRLLFLTDCALVVNTDLPGKLRIIQNATKFAALLGVTQPKVALLAAAEAVTPGLPVSLEEAVIAKMSERGQFPEGVLVDGPLSLDLAINPDAVIKKKMKSEVAGQADILVVNNIHIGNALFKSMITLCGAQSASTVVGPPIPIALTSRSEGPENVLLSLALTIIMAGPKES